MRVNEAVPDFADVFPFEEFNRMQRAALPAVLDSEENVVVSAPTASGKTALAELAICRTLRSDGTALFLAPLRALTNEKESEWERFEDLGYSVYVVTGERDLNPRRAERADVLVMTPEKADSATRKHDTARHSFITDVDCCIIDEVHLLDSDKRGSVLEVTVSRLRRLCAPRVVALSATMPNIEDVAGWLDAPEDCTFTFGEEYRPVPLHAGVETYAHGENPFQDKYRRLFRAMDLAQPHVEDGGQALVFVSSRQDTVRAAEKARDVVAERDIEMGARGDYDMHSEAQDLNNDTLRQSVVDGVAFHHAGLSREDKDRVEAWFRDGTVQLLFSTSTLAWGVNLPARCVVIRDTKLHDPLEGEVDMSPLDVLQMLGRAGRPGYDDAGYAYVVSDGADAQKYRTLLREGKEIESRLAEDLDAHLNAEVALGYVREMDDVMEWLETTFYYVRAQSAPDGATDGSIDYPFGGNLRTRARGTLDSLVADGFVEEDGLRLRPTPLGRLASKFYMRLDTAREFADLAERAAERPPLGLLATRGTYVAALVLVGVGLAVLLGDRNLVRRVEARVETGISGDAVGLTAVDGVARGRAGKLAAEGLTTPADLVAAGVEGLVDAGLSEGVAERVLRNARDLPVVAVDWGDFPDSIALGERAMCPVTVRSTAGSARAGVRVTVNGREMSSSETHLGETETTVGLFGTSETDELTYRVTVAFPDLPLAPVAESRTVRVD